MIGIRVRRKPEEFDAIQWTGDNLDEVREWLETTFGIVQHLEVHADRLFALYPGGGIKGMPPGDFIVKPGLSFAAAYEAVEEVGA